MISIPYQIRGGLQRHKTKSRRRKTLHYGSVPVYILQQRLYAPLLAEAAAVLGFRAKIGTRLGFDSIWTWTTIGGCVQALHHTAGLRGGSGWRQKRGRFKWRHRKPPRLTPRGVVNRRTLGDMSCGM